MTWLRTNSDLGKVSNSIDSSRKTVRKEWLRKVHHATRQCCHLTKQIETVRRCGTVKCLIHTTSILWIFHKLSNWAWAARKIRSHLRLHSFHNDASIRRRWGWRLLDDAWQHSKNTKQSIWTPSWGSTITWWLYPVSIQVQQKHTFGSNNWANFVENIFSLYTKNW